MVPREETTRLGLRKTRWGKKNKTVCVWIVYNRESDYLFIEDGGREDNANYN